MIDRRSDQLGKVLVCVHAVTIQHRGRATRSIDHDTHGHRLGQDKAQAGFEGSQEAGALDEEVAIASTPSRVRLGRASFSLFKKKEKSKAYKRGVAR